MPWSQLIVVSWIQFTIATAALLQISRVALRYVKQPADRIRLILCSLLTAVAIPLVIAFTPLSTWRLPIITQFQTQPDQLLVAVDPDTLAAKRIEARQGSSEQSNVDEFLINLPNHSDTTILSGENQAMAISSPPSAQPTPVPSLWMNGRFTNWTALAAVIVAVHTAGMIYFLVEWGLGIYLIRKLIREATPSTENVKVLWDHVTQKRSPNVRLKMSSSIDAPILYGLFRPVILIPTEFANAADAKLTFCLLHEFGHLKRHDLTSWYTVRLYQFLLWLQPSYWAMRTELRLQQDILADDHAARTKSNFIEYSELLIAFANRRTSAPLAGALTFLDHPSQLVKRVRMLLENTIVVRTTSSWTFTLAVMTAASLFAILIGGIKLEPTLADDVSVSPKVKQQTSQVQTRDVKPDVIQANSTETSKEKQAEGLPADNSIRQMQFKGRVVSQETGNGIANARVLVRRQVRGDNFPRTIEETKHTTDADGQYTFEVTTEQLALTGFSIGLVVDHDDYASKKVWGMDLEEVRKDEERGIRPYFERTTLFPAEAVTGSIVSPDGKPLAGVPVQAYSQFMSKERSISQDNDSTIQTVTNAEGKFRVNIHKNMTGVIWIRPEKFASIEKIVDESRGDLGIIKLTDGVRVTGRLLTADGKPVSRAGVNASFQRKGMQFMHLGGIHRSAITDDEGRFSFGPLSPGDYTITPLAHADQTVKLDTTLSNFPGVFIPKKVALKEGVRMQPVEIQAVPHVIINAQVYNSKGDKSDACWLQINGELDRTPWVKMSQPDSEGKLAILIPHGLKNCQFLFGPAEGAVITRFRRDKDKPFEKHRYGGSLDFGTINADIVGMEIVTGTAPVVLVSAVDEDQKPIKGFKVAALYSWGEKHGFPIDLGGKLYSHVFCPPQDEYRNKTYALLPDEEVTYQVVAPGYESTSEKLKLAEGESKELVLSVKKISGNNSTKGNGAK